MLPLMLFRDFTPANELCYLCVADEALSTHTFFAFTDHGAPYADKPPLYLWAVMLCKWLTGEHRMWLLSLFSLLPAIGITRIMDRWTAGEIDGENRALARIMLLTCGLFTGLAVTLRMDMLMCLFIVMALREFWKLFTGASGCRPRWLFPLYMFLAVFTKGPMGLLVPLVSTTVFLLVSRRMGGFWRFLGWRTWGVLAACCLVWFGAVYAEGGSGYLYNLVYHQTVGRAVNSFHHARPFYYYIVSGWYCLAPWSLLTVGTVVAALRRGIVRSDMQRFFLTVVVTVFVLLSCISSKLQVYMLPAFPFMVYVTAMFLPRFREYGLMRAALAVPAVLFVLAFPIFAIAVSSDSMKNLSVDWLYAAAAILMLTGLYAVHLLRAMKCYESVPAAIRVLGIGMLCCVFAAGLGLPRYNSEIGYKALCDKAVAVARTNNIDKMCTWRIRRAANMDVYLPRPVRVIPSDKAPAGGCKQPCVLMIKKDDIGLFGGCQVDVVGPYAVVVCP